MAGTATNLDGSQIILGPGKLWADVSVPAASSYLTLHTDGTPDSTANPNAKNLGLTEAGTEVTFGLETQDFNSDELTSPHYSRIISQPVSFKATLLQARDFTNVLKYVFTGGNYLAPSGKKVITFGGTSLITTYSFALICADLADATKFIVVHIYKGYNKSPITVPFTRKDQSKVAIEIVGQSIATRAEGDQSGAFWYQTA